MADSTVTDDLPELLVQLSVQKEGDTPKILEDDFARNLLLINPASPYSDRRDADDIVGDAGWQGVPAMAAVSDHEIVLAYARRMGLTKARPGIDVPVHPGYARYDAFIGAQATKAAIDEDIFRQALEYAGYSSAAIVATYAVGAQVLRDQLRTVPASKHEGLNLRPDVLERFMALTASDVIDDYDGEYLQRLYNSQVLDFRPGISPSMAVPYIPAPFRAARIAAAYHDMSGYFGGFPCQKDGRLNPAFAGTGEEGDTRALCFVDANDQDVHAWYVGQLQNQLDGVKRYPESTKESALSKLLRPIAIIGEVAGIASFINFATGIRAWVKGMIPSKPVRNMYGNIGQKVCKL
ncbi:hypothetical protein [Luteibacter aegosomatissinici]|uniref:hypothetical protein n=1 Tax=Luteibacter aegosomatissinici TaxID=2911539 RepID=UPI001FFB2982|nr:hypothetical protein [Luteibacter aegosomatissinici]UPG94941.1 hypothetical protein L2Y97_02200 [Luteibacter aegosomatissinici]